MPGIDQAEIERRVKINRTLLQYDQALRHEMGMPLFATMNAPDYTSDMAALAELIMRWLIHSKASKDFPFARW